MTFDKNLSASARRLMRESEDAPVPNGLRARVIAGLPDSPHRTTAPVSQLPKWAIGICVLGVAGGAGSIALHRTPDPVPRRSATNREPVAPYDPSLSLREEIRTAVNSAATWHVTGCAFHDIKGESFQVANNGLKPNGQWEFWGRRAPFFYRAEEGNEIVVDDGKTRKQLMPAFRPFGGATFRMPSGRHTPVSHPQLLLTEPSTGQSPVPLGLPELTGTDGLQSLLVSDERLPPVKPSAREAAWFAGVGGSWAVKKDAKNSRITTIERFTSQLGLKDKGDLTVDSQTLLPLRYTNVQKWYQGTSSSDVMLVQGKVVDATYGIALNTSLANVKLETDALKIDIQPTGEPLPGDYARPATIPGLAAHIDILDMDSSHDAACRLHWSLDSKPVSSEYLMRTFHLPLTKLSLIDQVGRRFLVVGNFANAGSEVTTGIIAPIEPILAGSPSPTQIRATITVQFSGLVASHIPSSGSRYEIPVTTSVNLPPQPTADIDKITRESSHLAEKFALELAEARSKYYMDGGDEGSAARLSNTVAPEIPGEGRPGTPPSGRVVTGPLRYESSSMTQDSYERAVYWTNQVIDEAKRDGKAGIVRIYEWRLRTMPRPR